MLSHENGTNHSKQWFVLIEDRFRGPYSEAQIKSTIEQGGLAGADLIWREGMLDWEAIAKVTEFNLHEDCTNADPALSQSAFSFLDSLEPEEESVQPTPISTPERVPTHAFPTPAFNAEFFLPETERKPLLWKNKYAAIGIVVATAILSYSLWYFTQAGFPVLKDLSSREMQELRAIASEEAYAGYVAGAALAPLNIKEPRFYIAANVTDGTELEVQLQGLRQTMVDSFFYSATHRVKTKFQFAKSPAFVQTGGKPLSMGEYTLTIFKDGVQIGQKTFFLGGVKDRVYAERLKSYQNKMRIQGEGELSEIRQVTALLEKQYNETNQRFTSRKGWEKFHEHWRALQGQIEILFSGVDDNILNNEFYHGSLYDLLGQATSDVSRLHAEHNTAFSLGRPDQQKIADLSRSSRAKLLNLRAKLIQAERQSGI